MWLHIEQASGRKKLLYSPDTDVYHIGLTNVNLGTNEVIVQLSSVGRDLKLLLMNKFIETISTDPDLSSIPLVDRAKTLQVLYIATECDFTSFFVGIGKAAFLTRFFRFSEFITGQTPNLPGTLVNTDPDSNGFLAFLRLVGVAYYLKNRGAFSESTPSSYYTSFNKLDIQSHEQHTYGIRAKIWE